MPTQNEIINSYLIDVEWARLQREEFSFRNRFVHWYYRYKKQICISYVAVVLLSGLVYSVYKADRAAISVGRFVLYEQMEQREFKSVSK